jgi:hypothetical protein
MIFVSCIFVGFDFGSFMKEYKSIFVPTSWIESEAKQPQKFL